MIELERWSNALERWLLLQRAMYGSGLGLTNNHMMLTTICNSTSWDQMPFSGLHKHCTLLAHKHAGRQNNHTDKVKLSEKSKKRNTL